MEIENLFSLYLQLKQEIFIYWSSLAAAAVVLVGWLLSIKKRLTLNTKIIFSLAYSFISAFVLLGLVNNIKWLELFGRELVNHYNEATTIKSATYYNLVIQHIQAQSTNGFLVYVYLILIYIFFLFLIWNNRIWENIREKSKA